MPAPDEGGTYRYTASRSLGAGAREDDPDTPGDQTSDMRELDLHPDTTVTVVGRDEERDLVLVRWTDLHGTPRTTSVEPDAFDQNFEKE